MFSTMSVRTYMYVWKSVHRYTETKGLAARSVGGLNAVGANAQGCANLKGLDAPYIHVSLLTHSRVFARPAKYNSGSSARPRRPLPLYARSSLTTTSKYVPMDFGGYND